MRFGLHLKHDRPLQALSNSSFSLFDNLLGVLKDSLILDFDHFFSVRIVRNIFIGGKSKRLERSTTFTPSLYNLRRTLARDFNRHDHILFFVEEEPNVTIKPDLNSYLLS